MLAKFLMVGGSSGPLPLSYPYYATMVNPDFATGDTTGWEAYATAAGAILPDIQGTAGNYYAKAAAIVTYNSWGQTVVLPSAIYGDVDAELLIVDVEVEEDASTGNADEYTIGIECLDEIGRCIGGRIGPLRDPNTYTEATGWHNRVRTAMVAPLTRSIRIRTYNLQAASGLPIEVYTKNYSVTLRKIGIKATNFGSSGYASDWTVTVGALGYVAMGQWSNWRIDGLYGGTVPVAQAHVERVLDATELTAVADGRAYLNTSFFIGAANLVDKIRVYCEFRDAGNNPISNPIVTSAVAEWPGQAGSFWDYPSIFIPANCAKIKIIQYHVRVSGTYQDAYIARLNTSLIQHDTVIPLGTPTHTKWRLLAHATQSGNESVSFGKIEMRSVAAGANVCTGGTPTHKSTWGGDGATYGAANALDGTTAVSRSAADEWLYWWQYEFASPINIAEVALTSTTVLLDKTPLIFTLQYYDSVDTLWITHKLFSNGTAWTASEQRVFTV
jgi:hypothetical protein